MTMLENAAICSVLRFRRADGRFWRLDDTTALRLATGRASSGAHGESSDCAGRDNSGVGDHSAICNSCVISGAARFIAPYFHLGMDSAAGIGNSLEVLLACPQ